MTYWKESLLPCSACIRDAVETIDNSTMQIALVVDEQKRLLGIITDRDLRRGILKKYSLEDSVKKIMNPDPIVASMNDDEATVIGMLQLTHFRHIPVLDSEGRIFDVRFFEEPHHLNLQENWVVLMLGGAGSRLRPLTEQLPKPLLEVGNKPLLETILKNFIEYGFHQFYFSVNYKAEMIEAYFGDGSGWEVEIRYLREKRQMGTAGALSLLPERPSQPFFVMNGDLLTKVNFQNLLDFHKLHQSQGTMCVREYDFQVPYGVVGVDHQQIVSIDEKPMQHFFVNAGIYVFEPEVLKLIPQKKFFNMPDLFDLLIEKQYETLAFPIREYWLDIGHIDDYKRAHNDFRKFFNRDDMK